MQRHLLLKGQLQRDCKNESKCPLIYLSIHRSLVLSLYLNNYLIFFFFFPPAHLSRNKPKTDPREGPPWKAKWEGASPGTSRRLGEAWGCSAPGIALQPRVANCYLLVLWKVRKLSHHSDLNLIPYFTRSCSIRGFKNSFSLNSFLSLMGDWINSVVDFCDTKTAEKSMMHSRYVV